ncbi:oligosaccharide flippase family protein [uncultured Maribacter sp.]|uniref:oligosaccharide flippase family protein n=1 Tax=uncultured Maribacter sp. TaxID=431308 RepID=UPI002614C6F7|nr:oligosaccharide flippase family protein [uncultured Maribacter sp.]
MKNFSVKKIFKNQKVKQAIVLYSSTIGSMLIGFLISVLNTKYLGKDNYGDFKFIEVLFSLIVLFSTFGFFYSCTYMTAKEENEQKKNKLFGAHIIIGLVISLFLILILTSYISFFYTGNLGIYIHVLLPFMFVLVFNNSLENILQGNNKIYSLSILKIGPKFIYLLTLLGIIFFFDELSLKSALVFFYASTGIIIVSIILKTPFSFKDLKATINSIFETNKIVGFPIYIGGVLGVASTHLSSLFISFFNNNTDFGFYALALTVSSPMGVLPGIVGTTLMRDFANKKKMPVNILKLIVIISLIFFVLFLTFLNPLFNYFYSREYEPAINLAILTSVAFLIHGFGDLYNKFLYAKGEGKKMRISSINIGLSNIILSLCLIPLFGSSGAAYVKIISSAVYLGTVSFFYYKRIK